VSGGLIEPDNGTTDESPRGLFHWPTFAADALLVSGGALFANLLNFVFHFALSRALGPDRYGSLATLLAMTMIVGVVGSSIGTVAMQETARLWALRRDETIVAFGRRMLRSAACIGAIGGGVALVLSVPLSRYLHIEDGVAWVAFALALFAGVVAAYVRGAIQGAHRFGRYAASMIAESMTKLAAGYLLVVAGFGVGGAMLGAVIAIAVGAGIALVPLVSGRCADGNEYRARQFGASASRLTLIYAALMALTYVDTVFAKHALSGVDAGYYAAAGLIARIIPFGIATIVPMVTPKAVAARHHGAALRRLLAISSGMALAGTAAALLVMEVWSHSLVAITFGAAYAPAAPLLRLYAVDTSLVALGLFGSSYLAAVGEYGIGGWLVAAVVVEAGAMAVWGTSPTRLLEIAIASNASVLPAVAALVARSLSGRPQVREAVLPRAFEAEFP
jgi:O-antigen/teichoic acid export membrane protein